jgi:hypothetical protein
MDPTLLQILFTLFQYSQEIDRLRVHVAELEAELKVQVMQRSSNGVAPAAEVADATPA